MQTAYNLKLASMMVVQEKINQTYPGQKITIGIDTNPSGNDGLAENKTVDGAARYEVKQDCLVITVAPQFNIPPTTGVGDGESLHAGVVAEFRVSLAQK